TEEDAESTDTETAEEGGEEETSADESSAEATASSSAESSAMAESSAGYAGSSYSAGSAIGSGPITLVEPADGSSITYDETQGPAVFSWSGGGGYIVFSRNASMNP